MALASVTYSGNGTSGPFSLPFPYIAREHIHAYVDEVEVPLSFLTNSTVSIPSEPGVGTSVKLKRSTPKTEPLVDWAGTANLTEENLDLQALQVLYAMQETIDLAAETGASSAQGFATLASTKANDAAASAEDASESADEATAQAGIATTQAGLSTVQAGVAATQAGIETTQAGIASEAVTALLAVGRQHQVGDIKFHTVAAVPPGWRRIKRDPQAILKTAAPELNAKYAAEGYPYGSTSTHFYIPGGAGLFLRPWDDTSTHDPDAATRLGHDGTPGAGNVLGSRQASENKQHSHGITQTPHSHSYLVRNQHVTAGSDNGVFPQTWRQDQSSGTGGANANITINDAGGAESRPANIAFPLIILVNPSEAGAAHSPFGLPYTFDAGTADADPGTGEMRLNHATPASATFLYVSKTGANEADFAPVWSLADSIDAATRAILTIMHAGAPSNCVIARVTGAVTDAGTYLKVPVEVVTTGGALADDAPLCLQISLASTVAGPKGDQGDPGVHGEQGDPGAAATITIGTITTVAPGDPATVTNVGTSSAAVFDFEIPRGNDGGSSGLPPFGGSGRGPNRQRNRGRCGVGRPSAHCRWYDDGAAYRRQFPGTDLHACRAGHRPDDSGCGA